jgi:TonB family protein
MLLRVVLCGVVSYGVTLAVGQVAAAQTTHTPTNQPVGPALVHLEDPMYPPIARAARVSGEVVVNAEIHADGSVGSLRVVSGPAMLHQAAVDSASHSTFRCPGCPEMVQEYRIVYSFEFVDEGDCCEGFSKPSSFERLEETPGNRMTRVLVKAPKICLCDPAVTITKKKTRSVKCLWLWKCSVRTD